MTIRPIPTGNAGDAPSESCISYIRALLLVGAKDGSKRAFASTAACECNVCTSELLHLIVL